jgi:hypothetical protein
MRIMCSHRRVLELAGRILIAFLPDVAQQQVIARTVIEPVGLIIAFCRAIGIARLAAVRIVNEAPPVKPFVPNIGAQDAVPVDCHTESLRVDVAKESFVPRCGLEPNLRSRSLRVA